MGRLSAFVKILQPSSSQARGDYCPFGRMQLTFPECSASVTVERLRTETRVLLSLNLVVYRSLQ